MDRLRTSAETHEFLGMTYRQLDYFARMGAIRGAVGFGYKRAITPREVICLGICKAFATKPGGGGSNNGIIPHIDMVWTEIDRLKDSRVLSILDGFRELWVIRRSYGDKIQFELFSDSQFYYNPVSTLTGLADCWSIDIRRVF